MIKKSTKVHILCDRCSKICNVYGNKNYITMTTKKGKTIHFCGERCKEVFFGGKEVQNA